MGRIINTPEGFIKKTIFVDLGENIKAAVLVSERTYGYADMAGVRYRELARIIGGANITEITLKSAEEMLQS